VIILFKNRCSLNLGAGLDPDTAEIKQLVKHQITSFIKKKIAYGLPTGFGVVLEPLNTFFRGRVDFL
jgi:hypothetical protein